MSFQSETNGGWRNIDLDDEEFTTGWGFEGCVNGSTFVLSP